MFLTKISSKGQIVIPKAIREKLRIEPGTYFDVRLENEDIILTPMKSTPIQRLYKRFAGESILDKLEKEHADEIAREGRT